MANNNLMPESQAAFELSVYLKAWYKETGYSSEDFKEAADWMDEYFRSHPVSDQNASIYMLTMVSAAYHAGKEKGTQL